MTSPEASDPKPSGRKTFLYAALTAVGTLLFVAAAGEFVLRQQRVAIEDSEKLEKGLFSYDPQLGWRLQANWAGKHRHHDFNVTYQTGADGFRGRLRKSAQRTAIIGDSFTFGFGVGPGQAFTALLDAADRKHAYRNFGVPSYSTDQEVLLIEQLLPRYRPGTVLLAVHLGDDLADNMRPYPLRLDNAKPYFEPSSTGLELRNVPVPRQRKPSSEQGVDLHKVILAGSGVRPGFWKGMLGESETTRRLGLNQSKKIDLGDHFQRNQVLPLALFQALVRRAKAATGGQDANLGLILLPGPDFVQDPDGIGAQYQDHLRQAIVAWARAEALPALDAAEELRRRYQNGTHGDYYENEGHLTAQGHSAVAKLLAPWIKANFAAKSGKN